MQPRFASELESLLQDLLAPNMSSLQALEHFGAGDLHDGIGDRVILDVDGIFRRAGGDVAQPGALGWNDGALSLVILRREQPEFAVVDVELAAFLANAAFAEDQHLLALAQRIHNDRPFFKRDMVARLHCPVTT